MSVVIKTVKQCGQFEEYVWMEGGLMRKAEFQELLAKNPKRAIEKLCQEPKFLRRTNKFVKKLANMVFLKAGIAGSVKEWR